MRLLRLRQPPGVVTVGVQGVGGHHDTGQAEGSQQLREAGDLGGLVRHPELAGLGHWSAHTAQHDDLAQLSVALIAGLFLGGAVLTAARMIWRRARTLAAAVLDTACMPTRDGLVIVDDEAADAYALPGLPGRVVVSTGMLHALDETEHDILLAHERTHLSAHHYAFVALAQFGAAATPRCARSPPPSPTPSSAGPMRTRPQRPATVAASPVRSARRPSPPAAPRPSPAPLASPSAFSACVASVGTAVRSPVRAQYSAGSPLSSPPSGTPPRSQDRDRSRPGGRALATAEAAHDLHLLLATVGAW
ncbi:M48 family metalloprotease [Streptomyces sp. NPDC058469]|uniref:M48 family metalloprotease n=1 Tax=Streptomyces sp. NPDC058469 TaxID=3346514 RepID=UPI003662EB54